MKIVIMGPQGSGKSTQAKLLADKLNLFYLSTGEASRKMARENTALGRKVRKLINSGHLVDDKTILAILKKSLGDKDGFVLEGSPRTIFQAKKIQEFLGLDKVFYLKVSQPVAIKRLTARRICSKCKANFNLLTEPPKKKGVCDHCGGKLVLREDDTEKAIKKRLEVYRQLTQPVLNFYRQQGILEEIDGERSVEEISADILKRLS